MCIRDRYQRRVRDPIALLQSMIATVFVAALLVAVALGTWLACFSDQTRRRSRAHTGKRGAALRAVADVVFLSVCAASGVWSERAGGRRVAGVCERCAARRAEPLSTRRDRSPAHWPARRASTAATRIVVFLAHTLAPPCASVAPPTIPCLHDRDWLYGRTLTHTLPQHKTRLRLSSAAPAPTANAASTTAACPTRTGTLSCCR
eukprot:TRINITY_DN276_c0_g1_i1.p1 TRINITY_DN276_c0_g1~~TRINITY_DN276_c0_g1_i1.p1  ORF type:complete len:204 (+),score=50.72 TRINITY_DN276_c0_g1_i1:62-673(+)